MDAKLSSQLQHLYKKLLERWGPQRWWPGQTRDEIIIGAVLTQNTSWSNVEKAIASLKEAGLCTLQALAGLEPSHIAPLIRSAGYFNVKADRLWQTARQMRDLSGESLESARGFLLGIRGIGPETADSILLYAFGFPIFVFDAYTSRILVRLGMVSPGVKYHELQRLFMENLDHDVEMFNEYHALFVRQGKEVCRPKPRCGLCVLNTWCEHAGRMEDGR